MNKIWKGLIALAIILSISSIILQFSMSPKVGYIDINQAFSKFDYAKETQNEIGKVKLQRKQILDSLQFLIESQRATAPESESLRELESLYVAKANYFEEHHDELIRISEEKVWGQINSYASDFGEKSGCQIIIGANGSGNLMYGMKDIDLTTTFIEFINREFNGK